MAKFSRISKPAKNKVYTKSYLDFLGVDFSKDAALVDDRRSPHAVNIIRGDDGFPEKRVGWRTLQSFGSKINGIYSFEGQLIVHAGSGIYKVSGGSATSIYNGCADNHSTGKCFKGKLCILTGREFLVYDGKTCVTAGQSEAVYAPITHIQRTPAYATNVHVDNSGGLNKPFFNWYNDGIFPPDIAVGVMPEGAGVNLISGKRKNTFEHSGGEINNTLYILDSKIDLGSRLVMKCITTGDTIFDITFSNNEEYEDGYYYVPQKDFIADKLNPLTTSTSSSAQVHLTVGNSEKNNCGFVICSPKISALTGFVRTPGIDNFSIEFTHTVSGYADRINKCTIMDVFENRVFFSGNPDYPNVDWYSGVNDPLFIPDINYTEIGLDSSKIMGYLKSGSGQTIIKSDGDGSTIYMRSYQTLSDGSVIFPVMQGTNGLGAVSRSMTEFLDDPVYLTRNGLYAIAQQDISSERALNIRSTRINEKLLKNTNLEEASMCEWNGNLLLCINGECFVADAAQKSYAGNKTGTFEYEWYYWTNIPATTFCVIGKDLYFGTADGKFCRFNNDITDADGKLRMTAYSDDEAAIAAEWATNLSDDGDFMQLKTMVRKGSGIFLKAYKRSSVEVFVKTDLGNEEKIVSQGAGIFSFDDIDFSDFTFNTSPYVVVPLNAKIKKYKAIQMICKNEKPGQAFGLGGITRRYCYVKTYK